MLLTRAMMATTALLLATSASALQNNDGVPVNDFQTMVGIVKDSGATASGTNIIYPRCILTARHVAEGFHHTYFTVRQGPDVNVMTAPFQEVAKIRVRPRIFGGTDKLTDLGVMWLTGYENVPGTNLNYIPKGLAGWDPVTSIINLADDTVGYYYGYGRVEGGSSGWLFHGDTFVDYYKAGSSFWFPEPGGYYHTINSSSANSQSCLGDSGGPLAGSAGIGAGIAGVISVTPGAACGNKNWSEATALTTDTIAGHKSNRDWVLDEVEMICGKEVQFGVQGGQGGSVIGSISPAQKRLVAEDHNGTNGWISCNNGISDCREVVHFGQTVTVLAQPDSGHEFVKWVGSACDCPDQFSATCTKTFEQIGEYGSYYSRDVSDCIAEFQPVGGY